MKSANRPLQRCKDCQQEVDDVEPNVEDALHEQQILETQTTIGSHVSFPKRDPIRYLQDVSVSDQL